MASIPPVIRHMLICDDVQRGSETRPKLNVIGLVHRIRAKPGQQFPIQHTGLCVYLVLTGGSGTGQIQVRITDAESDVGLVETPIHEFEHPPDRHAISGLAIRIAACIFPHPGLYWVEFHHDGNMLRREPVSVSEHERVAKSPHRGRRNTPERTRTPSLGR